MIVIVSPPFNTRFAGVVVLHRLYETLLELGFDAYIVFFAVPNRPNQYLVSTSDRYFRPGCPGPLKVRRLTQQIFHAVIDHGVVIYPEIIEGNPLGAKRVVRYLLNMEGALTGKSMSAGRNDLIVTYSKAFSQDQRIREFVIPIGGKSWYATKNLRDVNERSLNFFYIGKGNKYQSKFNPPKDFIEVSRTWPKSQEQFHALLFETRFFLSYDLVSACNSEAVLAGAYPIILGVSPVSRVQLEASEAPTFFGDPTLIETRVIPGKEVARLMGHRDILIKELDRRESRVADVICELVGTVNLHFGLSISRSKLKITNA